MNSTRRPLLVSTVLALAVLCGIARADGDADSTPAIDRPNFIVLLCDNLGYGDTEPFGSQVNHTPQLNRMAREGRVFTDFYATAGVCTPSRASLMTGCYPRRVNMHMSNQNQSVLWPASGKGLHPNEITIAEVLTSRGYATACLGKWHLGDQPAFLPTRQGFDQYFGIPYSEGMMARVREGIPPLPLLENERVVEAPVDCNLLTQRYTEKAVEYIQQNKDRPFILYLAHAMPGSVTDSFASPAFKGRSKGGTWGDKVEEIDWSTGQILDALQEHGIAQRTLVVWASDNGAPRLQPQPQGSNLPLSGWGYTTAEGGMRVPCIFWWPGSVPAGTRCREVSSLMDLLPTFAWLSGAQLPAEGQIDGKDIWPLIAGEENASSPHEAFFYYYMDQLQAVRSGRWKLYLALAEKRVTPNRTVQNVPAQLFDLLADPSETTNVADAHPDVVNQLMKHAEQAREDLGDRDRAGLGQRPPGRVDNPVPQVLVGDPESR